MKNLIQFLIICIMAGMFTIVYFILEQINYSMSQIGQLAELRNVIIVIQLLLWFTLIAFPYLNLFKSLVFVEKENLEDLKVD